MKYNNVKFNHTLPVYMGTTRYVGSFDHIFTYVKNGHVESFVGLQWREVEEDNYASCVKLGLTEEYGHRYHINGINDRRDECWFEEEDAATAFLRSHGYNSDGSRMNVIERVRVHIRG